MNPADRARLTRILSTHVAKVAADLRAQMLIGGPIQDRARRVYADEKVGEDYAVWTDLLARRAAVMWVLKSVYVRVLEDRGLLAPGRLLDPEAQQLFEKLAPNLGETAFLRWVYRDLATTPGGLPELFAPQPAEVAVPSDALSRELLALWRNVNPDTGARWSFVGERFDGELMGDLYQELDPVVKDRFALCQTPDFVRAFILDRSLSPAITEYGADKVRLIDPACGSGHFLIDALRRIVAATTEQHPTWMRRKVVDHALSRVVGTDLNDYACALARARLIMTAADMAGVATLREAAAFHPHVYWADGLEQVEREENRKVVQTGLFTQNEEPPARAILTRPEVREALREVLKGGFQAVVANPPYIVESDDVRKAYHREKVGKKQRYVSAYRQYSLGAPFTERCFQLAVKGGYVGIITSNNFMKREFGKPLIEEVLPRLDLTLIVDTSQAYIPFHGTPTVLLFGKHQAPVGETVRAVMGKRGETGTPDDPVKGKVWSGIIDGWETVGWENEFVSVAEMTRETLGKHPWSLGGGGAADIKVKLEEVTALRVSKRTIDVGRTTDCGEDPVYIMNESAAYRMGVADLVKPLAIGEVVRDWLITPSQFVLYPYNSMGGDPINDSHPSILRYFWRYRALLSQRSSFGMTIKDRGGLWYEHLGHYQNRLKTPMAIAFAFVATHNHFVIDRGGKLFNRSAPVIKLPATATEDDHYALLGLLNSSTLGFWMRQVFFPKGGESTGTKIQSEPFARRLEYDGTKLQKAPITDKQRDRIILLTRQLDTLAQETAACRPQAVLASDWAPSALSQCLIDASIQLERLRKRMIALQEELDWTVYVAFDLAPKTELRAIETIEPLASPHRPFAIRLAAAAARGEATNYWFEAMGVNPSATVPEGYTAATTTALQRRLALIESSPELALLETPEHKRKWEPLSFAADQAIACREWLADRVERAAKEYLRSFTEERLVAALMDDARVHAVIAVYTGRADADLNGLIHDILSTDSVPNHPYHTYTDVGLTKRAAWEEVWTLQRREDAGEKVGTIPVPPEYSQGSRGKSTDFLKTEYWKLRGSLDVPKERFIALTEVPGNGPTLYGWAGWTPLQRLKALLALDEKLEDAGHSLADRVGVLDSAWRLLPDVAREDANAAARLRAELAALVGATGPSTEMLAAWKAAFPPPGARAKKRNG